MHTFRCFSLHNRWSWRSWAKLGLQVRKYPCLSSHANTKAHLVTHAVLLRAFNLRKNICMPSISTSSIFPSLSSHRVLAIIFTFVQLLVKTLFQSKKNRGLWKKFFRIFFGELRQLHRKMGALLRISTLHHPPMPSVHWLRSLQRLKAILGGCLCVMILRFLRYGTPHAIVF